MDESGVKEVRLVLVEKVSVDGNIVGKIQIRGADAARQCSSEGGLQAARPERQQRFRIREEEPRRNLVLSAMELPVPIGRELAVSILPRLTAAEGRGRTSRLIGIGVRGAHRRNE